MRSWLWKVRNDPFKEWDDGLPERLELKGEVHQYLGQLWGRDHFNYIARTQRNLLERGYRLLSKGGVMVYSTCSLEPEENEAVVNWMVRRHPRMEVEAIERERELPGLNTSEPVTEWEGESYSPKLSNTLRIMPQDNHTDGFFIARLRKPR